jgi:hypothetical protein
VWLSKKGGVWKPKSEHSAGFRDDIHGQGTWEVRDHSRHTVLGSGILDYNELGEMPCMAVRAMKSCKRGKLYIPGTFAYSDGAFLEVSFLLVVQHETSGKWRRIGFGVTHKKFWYRRRSDSRPTLMFDENEEKDIWLV